MGDFADQKDCNQRTGRTAFAVRLLLILPKIMPPAGGKSQIFVKRKNRFNFLEARFVIKRFIFQNPPDLQKRPTSGIGYQTAVKFLLVVQEITPCI